MRYTRLPQTDSQVSAVALGCWAFAGDLNWGPQDDADSVNTVHAALDHGINFLDTAEGYGDGRSEEIVGRALQGRRHDAIIATKPKPGSDTPAALRTTCEQSLKRLGTDYIDLYQQHWPNRDFPLDDIVDTFERLKDEGKIRAFGVCNYGETDFDELLSCTTPATNQLAYSLIWRAIEYRVQQKCVDSGTGILAYSPIAQGLLTGKYQSADEVPDGRARTKHFASDRPQARHGEAGAETETFEAIRAVKHIAETHSVSMLNLAIGWVLSQPAVTSVLVGARRPDQIPENASAGDFLPPREIVDTLSRATDALKDTLGDNPDPWSNRMR